MTRSLKLALIMLIAIPFVFAQQVKPTSLITEAVPGYTSPPQDVRFYNSGSSALTVTITVTGPFAIPQNRCGRGVKPQSHCDVWVTYTAEGIGTDTGILTFTFDNQSVSVALTGNGVNSIPTSIKYNLVQQGAYFNVKVIAGAPGEGYVVPNGEVVSVGCFSSNGINGGTSGPLDKGGALLGTGRIWQYGGTNPWSCEATYFGDAEFGRSDTHQRNFWLP